MQTNNTTGILFEQVIADHHIKVHGRIGQGLMWLEVEGIKFSIEPCTPGYSNLVNLVNTATNKVVKVLPADTKTNEIAQICMEALKQGELAERQAK